MILAKVACYGNGDATMASSEKTEDFTRLVTFPPQDSLIQ
jgi:hypothetical protein